MCAAAALTIPSDGPREVLQDWLPLASELVARMNFHGHDELSSNEFDFALAVAGASVIVTCVPLPL